MRDWFNDRTSRERGLLLAASLLVVLLLAWQFMVKPVMEANQRAERAQTTALRDFGIVQSGVVHLSPAGQSGKQPFDRGVVIQVAHQTGVSISRVQPGQNEALQIWFEDAQVTNVYMFLTQISEQYGTRIGRVQISRRDGGVVSAQITLHPVS